ncbi:hypothetical protein RSOLAG22IIIB_13864 [Rhizoctonia solani]|uniref:N-acetyltransferase domain-containing protein n=1 Tax=Rhizoctonia solani TaxID=456999 RepID=A0A0K6FS93_9AGAM|nr:hypothetical protein RSOLAG22IIIB_13864 [Rhizoctonia solani]
MSEASIVTVAEITKETPNFSAHLEEMTILLSLAFSKPLDPMTIPAVGVTYENNPELHHEYSRAQLQAALTGAGRVFQAFININGLDRLAGIAVWYESGRQFLDNDEQRTYWVPFLNRLDSETRKWWREVMIHCYNQLTVEGLGEGTKKEILHLQVLGVHPDFHRRGVGTALVRHMLVQSDLQGIASCVETAKETNVLFYTSLGFEVKSEREIPSPHGDFAMLCLKREAGAKNLFN